MLAEHASAPRIEHVLSPFAFTGPGLAAKGYSALPIAPGDKVPGTFTGGEWHMMRDWQRFCKAAPMPNLILGWSRMPGAGVGIACGRGLVLVDIDLDEAVGPVMAALPPSIVGKKGAKGLTLCFRGDTAKIRSRAFKIDGVGAVDLLADGKQSVLPPSIHPKTGRPYEWMSERTLLDTPLADLTELPDNVAELIEQALRPLGYNSEVAFEYGGELNEARSRSSDFFRRLNEDALANLDAWVHRLGIRCERQRDGGWLAVPEWRPSSTGKPLSRRGLNLSFDSRGIRDFGDGGKPYTPLNAVMAARGRGLDDASLWLGEAIGRATEPFIDLVAGPSAPSVLARTSDTIETPIAASDVPNKPTVVATPFRLGNPASIPRREWLYGTALIRRFMSVIVAPGGVGKSSLTIAEALAMATGRPLLGITPPEPLRVWLWNGEDPRDELQRRIAAACLRHGVQEEEIDGRLFVDSGRDTRLVIMREVRKEIIVAAPVVEGIVSEINEKEIDVLIVDPFVTTHEVTENDNGAIARVAYQWSDIADRTGCAILLVHHARKTNGGEVTAEDSRGGIALVGAARIVRVLNPMTTAEAEEFGVSPDDRLSHVRLGDGKANLSRRSERGNWFRLVSVPLGNGSGNMDFGDEVAVATEWRPPSRSARATLSAEQIAAVKAEVAQGEHRLDMRSPIWVGNAVTVALDIAPSERGARRGVEAVIDRLITDGHLKVVKRLDAKRREKDFVEVA